MLPSFLGIGAQKAGTTWLHAMLSAHDELWLPHRKELHYFDQKFPTKTTTAGRKHSPGRGLLARRFLGRLRRLRARQIFQRINLSDWKHLRWDCRYYFGGWDDDWYESLFADAKGRMAGEITPAYSCLHSRAIASIHSLLPGAKLILLLRDPIDRAWSHAKMDLGFNAFGSQDFDTQAEFKSHFDGDASRQRGDYVGMIQRWTEYYPANQLFVGFYDEIQEVPGQLLQRIHRFLGVEASERSVPPTARRPINVGRHEPMPPHLQLHLARIYGPELKQLADRFGGYPIRWLERCNSILNSKP
jgi:hypothetical protein